MNSKSKTISTTTQPVLPINIYLGGSFDPVHNGHIAILQHVYNTLREDTSSIIKAYFLPTSRSPLKSNSTDPTHRLAMLEQAIDVLNKKAESNQNANLHQNKSHHKAHQDNSHHKSHQNKSLQNKPPQNKALAMPIYDICEQELWQPPPTYTIDTLNVLRQQNLNTSLVFIVGADNIASLEKWRDGLKLTEFAHLWIVPRGDWQSPADLYQLLPKSLQVQATDCVDDLKYATHGRIYIDSKSILPIASSDIRAAIANTKLNDIKFTLPSSVYSYIIDHNLYRHE